MKKKTNKNTNRLSWEPVENIVYYHERQLKDLAKSIDLLNEKIEILFDLLIKTLKILS